MSNVSNINITVNLDDSEFVDSIIAREMHMLSSYTITVQVMDGNAVAEAGLPVSIKIYDSGGSKTIAGTVTDANGKSVITIADDDIDFSGSYTALFIVNSSKSAKFPITIYDEGSGVPIGTTVDWSDVQSYRSTPTDGPYTAGTNVTFGTADADGKVPINATGGGSGSGGYEAAVTWDATGTADVTLPSALVGIYLILIYSDALNTGVVFQIGTVADPDAVYSSTVAFEGVRVLQPSNVIAGGVLRLTVSTAGAAGAGKIIVYGGSL